MIYPGGRVRRSLCCGFKVHLDLGLHLLGEPRVDDPSVRHDECEVVGQDFFRMDDVAGVFSNLSAKVRSVR